MEYNLTHLDLGLSRSYVKLCLVLIEQSNCEGKVETV